MDEFVRTLRSAGWEFVPVSDNDWKWMKFDKEGKPVAKEGDEEWYNTVGHLLRKRPTWPGPMQKSEWDGNGW